MKKSLSFLIKTKTLLLMLFMIIIIVQVPFHYTEQQFKNTILNEMKLQQNTIKINQIKYENRKEEGLLRVYVFNCSLKEEQQYGCAIFVKHIILPLYRVESIYIEDNDKKLSYLHAVTDLKEENVVEIEGNDIKIYFMKSVFGEIILKYLILFTLVFLLIGFKKVIK